MLTLRSRVNVKVLYTMAMFRLQPHNLALGFISRHHEAAPMSWIQRDMSVYPSVFAGWHRPETDPFFGTPIRGYHDLKNISIILDMIIQTAPRTDLLDSLLYRYQPDHLPHHCRHLARPVLCSSQASHTACRCSLPDLSTVCRP